LQQGWQLLNEFRIRHPQWVTASIDDLSATIGYALFEHTQDSTLLDELEQILKQSGLHTDRLRYLQCLISFQKGHVIEADQQFEQFLSQTTDENLQGEAYIWRAQCAEKLGNEVLRQHHLKQLFTQLPQHPQAPLAYLHFYPYQSYMQGERQALKHLRHLPSRFPHAPCTIFAYYLMGLEKKKNQFDSEGNLQKQHDLTTAIDYFQLAETAYDYLKSSIPLKDQRYFLHVSLRAQLERAQINLAIAHESIGTKKHIYLNYSEQVFNELLDLLKDDDWKLWEEASFGLVQVYLQQERDQQAEALLDQMLTHYKYLSISTSPFITKVWIEKGYLAHKQLQYEQALTYFRQAETVFNCSSSAEEKLEIWIEQSMCCRILNRLDEAMRLLSKVINEEIASSLRVKAMFLRAEIYEQQGRHELALKQLESVVKKGGTWAYQAQEKLKEYGYPCTSIL
jgi:tetratricopeptide (TPR) repeat protein